MDERGVDLVADHDGIVGCGQFGHCGEILAGMHRPRSIVRVTQQHRPGARAKCILDAGQIQRPVSWTPAQQRNLDEAPPAPGISPKNGGYTGGVMMTWSSCSMATRSASTITALTSVVRRTSAGIDSPGPLTIGESAERLSDLSGTVAVPDVGGPGLRDHRVGDDGREREIHLRDEHRQDVVGVGPPLHAGAPTQCGELGRHRCRGHGPRLSCAWSANSDNDVPPFFRQTGVMTFTARDFPVRIGVQLQPQHAPQYSRIRDAVRRAEDLGVDIAFNWDHFYPLYGDPDGEHFECWTMLGAWAEQTTRVEIGALVTCNSYRNPELLADMARTVDHISDGRLILGIGSGWFQKDYDEYGYEFGTAGGRLDDLGAALPRISDRLGKLNPAPTRDIPVLIGGGGEKKTLRHVAEYANIWHYFVDVPTYERKSEILDRHCADVGRDPSAIEHSAGLNSTDPDDALKKADELVAAGISLITIGAGGPDYDLTVLEALCKWRDSHNS